MESEVQNVIFAGMKQPSREAAADYETRSSREKPRDFSSKMSELLRYADNEFERLQNELAAARKENDEVKESLGKDKEYLRREKEELRESLMKEKEERQKERNELETKFEKLAVNYSELGKKHSELTDNFNNLKDEKESLEAKNSGLEAKIAALDKESRDKIAALEGENRELERNLSESNAALSEKIEALEKVSSENGILKEKCENTGKERDKTRLENEKLKEALEKFGELGDALSAFGSLPDEIKEGLSTVLGEGTPENILKCAINSKNIKNLGDMIWENHIKNDDLDDETSENLKRLFDYMLNTNSRLYPDITLKISVSAGEPFDDEKHLHLGGQSRGNVTKVLLNGLEKNGKVEIKAIVK